VYNFSLKITTNGVNQNPNKYFYSLTAHESITTMFLARHSDDSFLGKSVSLQMIHINKPEINIWRKAGNSVLYTHQISMVTSKYKEEKKKKIHDFPPLHQVSQVWIILLKSWPFATVLTVQYTRTSIICIKDPSTTASTKLPVKLQPSGRLTAEDHVPKKDNHHLFHRDEGFEIKVGEMSFSTVNQKGK